MNRTFTRIVVFSLICLAVAGCKKKDKMSYHPVGTINNVAIKDIVGVDSDMLLVLGSEKNKSVVYSFGIENRSSEKRLSKNIEYNDICFDNGTTWLCGNDMNIRVSNDTARSVDEDKIPDFSYWDEWPTEKSNMVEMYVKDGKPRYAIGKRDMLKGNFYLYNNDEYFFHGNTQVDLGLNDMVVVNDTVYIAGYGSILRVTNNGADINYEEIGDENFTSIAVGNGKYLYASTYSGKIYRSKIGSNEWEKINHSGKHLLFVEANDFGDVVAMGESREVLVSTDFGNTWREEKYDEGNKVSCLVSIDNVFYVGTEKGTIIKMTKESLDLNVED